MTRQEATEKLKNAELILVSITDWGRSRAYNSIFPYIQVRVLNKDFSIEKIYCEECPYWNERKDAYAMSIWGVDRVFELIYSITRDLKLTNELFTNLKVKCLW